MKTNYPLLLTLMLFLNGCLGDPDPDPPVPDSIQSYFNVYNFFSETYNLTWEINDSIAESDQAYGATFLGSTKLDQELQDVTFSVKESGSSRVIASEGFSLEQNHYYFVSMMGNEEDPHIILDPMELEKPSTGMIKLRFFHATLETGPVDLYIGGDLPEYKVASGISFTEASEYLEATQEALWKAIIITPHNLFPTDSSILSFTNNVAFIPNNVYLGVIGHTTSSVSSALRLQLYKQPTI